MPRAVGDDLATVVKPASWPVPAIFERIAAAAHMTDADMRATFNCGIGFGAVVEPAAATVALDTIRGHGIDAWAIGTVEPATAAGERYVEA